FFQAEDGIRDLIVTGVQTCALPISFRVNFDAAKDVAKYECFYLRPTNGRADDQVRRNHSTQYISHPDFPWFRLRKEFPEKYESRSEERRVGKEWRDRWGRAQ